MTTIASTQHTPGPWYVAEEHPSRNGITTPDSFRHLCVSTPRGEITCFQGCGRGDAECEANARLIAAAPELLVVCKSIALELTQHGDIDKNGYIRIDLPSEDVMALRDAIARAADT